MSELPIILASSSKIRHSILRGAGVAFTVKMGGLDEDKLKETLHNCDAKTLAYKLALAKAQSAAEITSGHIIGADQVMEMDGIIYDKPNNLKNAKARLWDMRGKTHRLIGGLVCLNTQSGEIWSHMSETSLTVRKFSRTFLDDYIDKEGEDILYTVGGYKFEGRGAQLFSDIKGDYFSILGLSLLPLLAHLRQNGAALS